MSFFKYSSLLMCLLLIFSGWPRALQVAIAQTNIQLTDSQTTDLDTATNLNAVSVELYDKGFYESAILAAQEALAIREEILGPSHPDVAQILYNLAFIYREQGEFSTALPLYERAISINEAALGPNHPDVARILNSLAHLHNKQGNYSAALPLYERVLSIRESTLGYNHPDVARSLSYIALLHYKQGNYSTALPLYERALVINEAALGSDHPIVASSLNNVALSYYEQGDYSTALPLFERALAIREAVLGANHPDVATSLSSMGLLYNEQGDYGIALPLLERSLKIREAALEAGHPDIALSLNNVGLLYLQQGNYSTGLPFFERALSANESTFGPEHPSVAQSLSNLGLLYARQNNYSAALPRLERALLINEAALGPNHPTLALILNNLALIHYEQKRYSAALSLFERAFFIREAALGADHPSIALALNNLGNLYYDLGIYDKALTSLERALSIRESSLGQNHPSVAQSLSAISLLYYGQENYSAALPLLERALSIRESSLGSNHPDLSLSLNNLALVHYIKGDYSTALTLLERALSIDEQNLSTMLTSASEERRQQYINALTDATDSIISMSLNKTPERQKAIDLAVSTVLRRKGRVLDATGDSFRQLARQLNSEDKIRLEQLRTVRSAIANLQFSENSNRDIEQYQAELQSLELEAQEIEEQLARRSAAFKTEVEPVKVKNVQELLPADTALVEFVRYDHHNHTTESSERTGKPHYAAYIVSKQGDVQVIDIGAARSIDRLIANYQNIVNTPPSQRAAADSLETASKALEEKIVRPLRPFFSDRTQLLISPDSHLNLVPFESLVGESGRYLINDYKISYLTSGRDLLKLKLNTLSQQSPVIIANPNYDSDRPQSQAATTTEIRSVDLASLQFGPLPGTQSEADAIAPLLPDVTIYTQQAATEEVLKQVQAPRILHIATHGFFLPDVTFMPTGDSNRGLTVAPFNPSTSSPVVSTPSNIENPLLRSGLALAGFNSRSSGSEDGVFTALEASSLNLYGTALVVLSACETGAGEATTGEGVYGLRRAFTIAGAQSQLMSLWQVSDQGTAKLMEMYYDNLINKGQGRSEALRNAQLAMMEDERYSDPFYWSAFIFSGDWRPIN